MGGVAHPPTGGSGHVGIAEREEAGSESLGEVEGPVRNLPPGVGRDAAAQSTKRYYRAWNRTSGSLSWIGADVVLVRNEIAISVYAPTLVGDEKRPLAIAQGMERALPDLRLAWTTSEKEDLIPLPNRDQGLATDKTNGGFSSSATMTTTAW
jgi:hypothetical protein